MTNTLADFHFVNSEDSLNSEIKLLEKYKTINEFLRMNDWLFISPLFFQGFELDYFYEISKEQEDQKDEITALIYKKFYDLNWTATFVDGYCKRCSHIKPFLLSIENSIILAYQRDYEGSIKTLIPIVEGILRRYLNLEKGFEMHRISFEKLKNSFLRLKEDLIEVYKARLLNGYDQNNNKIKFKPEQVRTLLTLKSKYYDIWFSFIKEFIEKSFYLNTHGQSITNELSRHAILHEFGLEIRYNLENYLKIYFVIQFLTWGFLQKEGKSILNPSKGFRYLEKVVAYKNIIQISETLFYEKHLLLKSYDGYDSELLKRDLKVNVGTLLPTKDLLKYKVLRKMDKFFWRKK